MRNSLFKVKRVFETPFPHQVLWVVSSPHRLTDTFEKGSLFHLPCPTISRGTELFILLNVFNVIFNYVLSLLIVIPLLFPIPPSSNNLNLCSMSGSADFVANNFLRAFQEVKKPCLRITILIGHHHHHHYRHHHHNHHYHHHHHHHHHRNPQVQQADVSRTKPRYSPLHQLLPWQAWQEPETGREKLKTGGGFWKGGRSDFSTHCDRILLDLENMGSEGRSLQGAEGALAEGQRTIVFVFGVFCTCRSSQRPTFQFSKDLQTKSPCHQSEKRGGGAG